MVEKVGLNTRVAHVWLSIFSRLNRSRNPEHSPGVRVIKFVHFITHATAKIREACIIGILKLLWYDRSPTYSGAWLSKLFALSANISPPPFQDTNTLVLLQRQWRWKKSLITLTQAIWRQLPRVQVLQGLRLLGHFVLQARWGLVGFCNPQSVTPCLT